MTEMSIAELLDPPAGSVQARDRAKLRVEAHRRLSAPLTALSFTMVALVAVLMGTFRRHGGLLRPMVAVLAVVGLLALQLMLATLRRKQSTADSADLGEHAGAGRVLRLGAVRATVPADAGHAATEAGGDLIRC